MHTNRIEGQRASNPERHHRALVETLARRFYINEQGVHVSNGLSTDLIAFPSDNFPKHKAHVSDKIRNAMGYATAFKDIKEIYALKHIALHDKDHTPDDYVVLGLYMFLEDECSRLGKSKTFLTAMREAGATLTLDDKDFTASDLLYKAKAALTSLDMKGYDSLLDSWFANAKYQIEGEEHSGNGTKAGLRGAYAKLAQDVSMHNPKMLGLNLSISYAVGNREAIRGKSVKEVYEMTRARTQPDNVEQVDQCIVEGEHIREKIIRDEIKSTVDKTPREYAKTFPETDRRAKAILNFLPDAVLEVLNHDWYMFAYSDAKDMSGAYPVADRPGVTADDNISARGGKALRQARYHMIFLSNGDRNREKDPDGTHGANGAHGPNGNGAIDPSEGDLHNNEPLKNMVVAQSILHESMHVIIEHLSQEQKDELKLAVEAMHSEMQPSNNGAKYSGRLPCFKEYLKTINTNSLAQVLDYDSGLYTNYKVMGEKDGKKVEVSDTRWEEVACNVMGLMHTDFPYPPTPQSPDPYADLRSFGALAGKIETLSENMAEGFRKEKEDIRKVRYSQKTAQRVPSVVQV